MKLKQFAIVATFSVVAAQGASVVTQWNFNSNPADNSTGTGSTSPSMGSGTVTVVGGVTTTGFNSGAGSSDPAASDNTGYQTTTYPAQLADSGTAGAQFATSTVGFSSPTFTGLELSFDLRISNTSSRWYRLDHSNNAGASWILGSATRLGTAASAGDIWFNTNTVLISDAASLNNPDFQFRVVSVFSGNAFTEANSSTNYAANTAYEVARNTTSNYGGGTWRFDMGTVNAVPEPSSAFFGSLGVLALLRRRR